MLVFSVSERGPSGGGAAKRKRTKSPLPSTTKCASGDSTPRKRLCRRASSPAYLLPRRSEGDRTPTKDRRTLVIEYWSRSDECLERKWDHMDKIDGSELSREAHILATTLHGRRTLLEPNMFPYSTPEGIEHWTLWSRDELSNDEVERCVSAWIEETAPHVCSWNFDDNSSRSIDLFHVHVYFCVPAGQSVIQTGK